MGCQGAQQANQADPIQAKYKQGGDVQCDFVKQGQQKNQGQHLTKIEEKSK